MIPHRAFQVCAMVALLTVPAGAGEVLWPPERLEGLTGETLSSVVESVTLVRRTREIEVVSDGAVMRRPSDLRVSLLVMDHGPATDVSPRYGLHLAMFNVIEEHGIAWSLSPVASVWAFHGAQRTDAGIYEIAADLIDNGADCLAARYNVRLDARALSVAVRRAEGVAWFESRRVDVPLGIEAERIGCVD